MPKRMIWKQSILQASLILLVTVLFISCGNKPVKDDLDKKNIGLPQIRTSQKLCRQGIQLLEEEKYEQAVELFDRALEVEPDYYQCWHNKAIIFVTLNKYEEALAANRKALEIMSQKAQEEQNYEVWSAKGLLHDMSLEYEQALTAYNKALEMNPDSLKDWFLKGALLEKMDRYEEALDTYNQAIKVEPELNWFWRGKGGVLLKLERYQEALLAYEQAIKLDEKQYFAWMGKYNALQALGRHEEAGKVLIKVEGLERKEENEPSGGITPNAP